MMAVSPTLMHSPNTGLMSAFSPYTDSPSSPAPYHGVPSRHSDPSGHLHPHSRRSPLISSPSDISNASPIAPSSNGTDTTDIDDSMVEAGEQSITTSRLQEPQEIEPSERQLKLETVDAVGTDLKSGSSEEETPSSVIHAPKSFESFHARRSPPSIRHSTPALSQKPETSITSPSPNEIHAQRRYSTSPLSPLPLNTATEPARNWVATPRAQTRQEAEAMEEEKLARLKSRSLADIPEAQDVDPSGYESEHRRDSLFEDAIERLQETADEVAALKLALSECWTLCNTLAGLSYIHRERIFSHRETGDHQEQAWKSCWKLCQKLYETRDEDHASQVRPTLDLCREFCQALFEVRQRENDVADSVLRVSFELNNHLYNTHDRALPEAFRERTLDFYITLCHRLMKQRTRHGEETDSLLRACWSLAEMLFSLRQNKRDNKPPDAELLGSAVQACWELCDLFREGWTQVRPDRGTPRPSQTTFTQAFQQAKQSELAAASSVAESDIEDDDFGRQHPETPTTVFEDTQQVSPDDIQAPNILVLGPDSNTRFQVGPKWSSSSSTLSGYSQSSETTTSSTSTIINPSEDPRLTCLKLLVVSAAIHTGFSRSSHPHQKSQKLPAFVKSLPSNAFGSAPWQLTLLDNYKKCVVNDAAFRNPGPPRRASQTDVAHAVGWMVGSGQYGWLRDLFRLVCGVEVDEVRGGGGNGNVSGVGRGKEREGGPWVQG